MKKILLILLLVLMLCSCGVSEETVPEEPQSEPEISGSSVSEPEENEWHPLVYDRVDKNIFEYEFRHNEWMDELSERGVFVSIENREFTGKETWEAELVFKNSNTELVIPFSGIFAFNGNIYYGTVLFPDEKTAVFCGNGKAVFFNTETLEVWDFEPEFPDFEKENIWVNGAGINEKTGEIVLFVTPMDSFQTDEAKTSVIVFNEKGITEFGFTELRGTAASGEKKNPFFFRNSSYFEYKGEGFLRLGYEIINLENGIVWKESGDLVIAENREHRLEMAYIGPKQDIDAESGYLALLYKNGKVINSMVFSEPNFCDPNYAGTDENPTIEINGEILTYRFDYFAMILTLDFGKGTHKLEYSPTDTNIDQYYEPKNSTDGKFSLYSYGHYGAGDIMYCHVSIRDNETGKHKYLGQRGGMYGGKGGAGFLKNNDVYIFGTGELHIFDPATGEIKFDLGKNFSLGYDSETDSERGILTFRRNPEDMTFILVYYEYENGFEWDEEFRGSCNYKIGFLDSEGNLLESYDTGCPLYGDPFGLYSVDMRYSEEELLLIGTGGKGGKIQIGTFDMETKEFKTN